MYRKFKVDEDCLNTLEDVNPEIVEGLKKKNEKVIKENSERLEKVLSEEMVDVEALKAIIFPIDSYDIFISHSHRDLDKILSLKHIIEKYSGLKCFVDSTVWDSYTNTQKKLEKEHAYNSVKKVYRYHDFNVISSNLHLILNSALQSMINNTEMFLFIESENSISIQRDIETKELTRSPWIMSELLFAEMVKVTVPKRRKIEKFSSGGTLRESVGFDHKVDTSSFIELNNDDFTIWIGNMDKKKHALNQLYDLKNV